jgi:hypothetical protein
VRFEYFARPQVDDEPRPVDWHGVYLLRALRRRNKQSLDLKIKQLFDRRDEAIVQHLKKEQDDETSDARQIPNSEIVIFHLPLLPFKEPLLGLPDETVADIFGLDLEQSIRMIKAGCLLSKEIQTA